MKKLLIFLCVLMFTPVLAGLYGALHDEFTYTISYEYFTRFKFIQFGLVDGQGQLPYQPRIGAAIVGVLATWWTGIFIGLFNGMIGLLHKTPQAMRRSVLSATWLTLAITLVCGLVGVIYGWFLLSKTGVSWPLPDHLNHPRNFIAVGAMHNGSYLGGLLGLVIASAYQLFTARKTLMFRRR